MILPPPPQLERGATLATVAKPRKFAGVAVFWLAKRCDHFVCHSPNFPTLGPWRGQDWKEVMKLAEAEIVMVVNTCRNLKQPIPFVENNRPAPRGCDIKALGFV